MRDAGFGTIEAIVAVALLSVAATAVTSTLVLARRLQTGVAAERAATLLAATSLERLRAGGVPGLTETPSGVTIRETLQPWNGSAQLLEAHVRVTWENAGPRSIELRTLIKR
jgi:type II secretory pathway pseudopilin PulG